MSTLLEVLGVAGVLGGVALAVVYYMRKAATNAADLAQTDEALAAERAHVAAMEAAAAEARRKRRVGFDAASAAVKSPADAAELLRSATDSRETN